MESIAKNVSTIDDVFDTSPRLADSNRMFTYLKGFFDGGGMPESQKALIYSRKVYEEQKKENSELYFGHPLTMACHATSMGIKDDRIIATILLHDVIENCNVPLQSLPSNNEIKGSVSLVSYRAIAGADEATCKKLYYEGIKNDYAASICKIFDWCNIVSMMAGGCTYEELVEYIKETEKYIYPLLRHVKENFPKYSNEIYVLRYHIDSVVLAFKIISQVESNDIVPRVSNPTKMFTYLKGFFDAASMPESKKALGFARRFHGEQKRDSGELYITHPLTMACHATSMGIKDDRIIATILLHDVIEDCNVSLDSLPFSDDIKHSVSLVTFQKGDKEEADVRKKLYYEGIKSDYAASICKIFDRCNNVSTMPGVFGYKRLVKYIKETEDYVYPLLRDVKENFTEYSNAMYVLRYHIDSVVWVCKLIANKMATNN